jgi:hypothetical protein
LKGGIPALGAAVGINECVRACLAANRLQIQHKQLNSRNKAEVFKERMEELMCSRNGNECI